jgi:carboxypeptidase Taq
VFLGINKEPMMSSPTTKDRYQHVMARAAELADLESAGALLGWDQETFMPKGGADGRSQVSSTLAGVIHQKLTHPGLREDIDALDDGMDGLDDTARAQVQELARLSRRAAKVPERLVMEMAQTQSKATWVWAEARERKDYPAFAPYLEKIYGLKREAAEAIGYEEEPYEALLDEYEPGAKVSDIARTLAEVRDFLIPMVKAITDSGRKPDPKLLAGPYDTQRQDAFGREIVAAMGFDMGSGRLDLSAHPFTSGIHAGDVRLTTRYKDDLSVGLFGTMHEAGHGIYEQNLPAEHRRTPIGTSTSLGIHESQSRMWENLVGRSMPFWTHFYPKLQALFPEHLGSASLDEFYRAINTVQPSFIRIEADEVTYNLHIILRFELERELLSGKLAVKNLPEAWNQRFERYLGLTPPTPDLGVMQDIHWASGYIGYFPTYTLGNLYASQLYEAAVRDVPGLEQGFTQGNLIPLRDWLVEHVHRWGRRYSTAELVERATGRGPTGEPFTRYLKAKFGPLYGLS